MLTARVFFFALLGSVVQRGKLAKADEIPWALRFLEEPADTQFAHTRSAILNCKVEDRPKATITWQIARTGYPINKNITGVRHILPNGSLYFPAFAVEKFTASVHNTDYQCNATNSVGTLISRIAKLRAVITQPFKVYAQDNFVIRGNTAVMKSVIPEHVRDYVRVLSWHIKRDVITLGGKYSLMPSGDLIITNVDESEAKDKTYYYTAVNVLTGEKHYSNPAKIFLKDQQETPPRVLTKPFNITIQEGDTSKLQCVAEGFPIPAVEDYSWRKDGVVIQMGHRFSRFAGGSLKIKPTQFQDQGLYECTVKNSKGNNTLYVYLTVLVPLKYLVRPQRKVAPVLSSNTGTKMECDVTGQPKPNITWLQNGKIFPGDERITVEPKKLVFAVMYSKDVGVYQCIADNGLELVQSSAVLITGERNPSIRTSADRVVLNRGEKLHIWCKAFSQSRPEVTWYLDNVKLHEEDGYSMTQELEVGGTNGDEGTKSTLRADTLDVRRTGEYKCEACNTGNCTANVIEVFIDGTTNITSLPPVVNATVGHSLQLPCVAKGYPVPTVTWSKDGVRIPFDHLQSVSSDNTFHISKVQKGDAGRYKCTAVNRNNIGDEGFVDVTVFELPNPKVAFSHEWLEGQSGTLSCSSITHDGSLNLRWQKDGKDVVAVADTISINYYISLGMSFLQLKRLTAADSGEYKCVASNIAGTASVSQEMVVYAPPSIPQQNPITQQILKTYTTYLTCVTSGTPPPRIDWYKFESVGGKFVPVQMENPRFRKMLNGTLVIRDVRGDDDGTYSCAAYNAVFDDKPSSQVRLIVHVPATVVTAPANTAAKVSDDVKITCVAVGNLPIQLAWFNGSRKMRNNSRVTIKSSVEKEYYRVNGSLHIQKLLLQDTKQYSCRVTNEFGSDTKPFQITVQQEPSPPSMPVVKETEATSIYLTWSPGFDGNAPIIQYIVEFKLRTRGWDESKRRVARQSNGLQVDGLRPASEYELRVYAVNKLGKSDASHYTTRKTLEAAPSQAPKLKNVTAVSSKEIYVAWEPPPVSSRNGVLRGYFVLYREDNKYYRDKNLTVRGGERRNYLIRNLKPYKIYLIEIQAFTRAGVSPRGKERKKVQTHEDVPSQPPQSVRIRVLSSQSMEVKWKEPPKNTINGQLRGHRVYYYSTKNPKQVFDRTVTRPNGLNGQWNVTLTRLNKFTTYKIQVAAFTRIGTGMKSLPRTGTTLEDIPGPPSNVQAIPVFKQTIRVLWDPPLEPNGIIREYRLYYRKSIADSLLTDPTEHVLSGNMTSKYLPQLESETEYSFWVKASTSIGVGGNSTVVTQMTQESIPANIFYDNLPVTLATRSTSAILECEAYGYPKPSVMWYSSGRELTDTTQYRLLTNGSLEIISVREADAGDYECTASNKLGIKTVIRKLKVKTTPLPPKVIEFKILINSTALNITWRGWNDGNSLVTMFILEYKVKSEKWKAQFISNINYYLLYNVDFNKVYYFRISALNAVGQGTPSAVRKVVFRDGNTLIVTLKEAGDIEVPTNKRTQFYRNPAFFGVLIGVGGLIIVVIVCVLLVAFRGGRIDLDKFHDWRKYWKGKILREQLPVDQEDYDQRRSNPDQSEGSPASNGNMADSSSSLDPMRSTHGSEISLPTNTLRNHFAQETIMEEDYPPPPPPYHSGTPGQAPPNEGSFSDTSSEGNFNNPVYHRPILHDTDSAARARRFADASDHGMYPTFFTTQRSLNGTPGIGVLGFRGHADGGSELDTTSISRTVESNIDLRHSAGASRLSKSKSRGQSQELVHPVYSQSPASGAPRSRDSGLGPSRNELRRTSLNSKRSSSQVTPVLRPMPTPQRRESGSSKELSPYHRGYDRTLGSRDPRAYDSASSEYSSSRDELISALEFGKRHNLDQYYGIPTLETTSVSSTTTNSSDQDGICKFTGSPRPLGDGCYAPTPVHAPPFHSRSKSRGNENYIYVLDPRRRGAERGAAAQPNGSMV